MVLDTAGIAFGELLIWVSDGYLSSSNLRGGAAIPADGLLECALY